MLFTSGESGSFAAVRLRFSRLEIKKPSQGRIAHSEDGFAVRLELGNYFFYWGGAAGGGLGASLVGGATAAGAGVAGAGGGGVAV